MFRVLQEDSETKGSEAYESLTLQKCFLVFQETRCGNAVGEREADSASSLQSIASVLLHRRLKVTCAVGGLT